jgi:hypothetical protein
MLLKRGEACTHRIDADVILAQSFYGLCIIVDIRRVHTDLILWKNNSWLHIPVSS